MIKVSEAPNPERDMITKLANEGKIKVTIHVVRMMGGPLDGKEYAIDPEGTEMELTDPGDAHMAVREGRPPKLLGLYKRHGPVMIWQKEYDKIGRPSNDSTEEPRADS